ncbi:glycerophosphodiester phosphodiesterase family protein [Humibacter ginsenosidimutans]|uniref:glycerophosphodiester phosphodiesterase n=1 Tax=Humibacter ginsenosidimutans TaxID=2599293 RepID=A0A5B8M4H5_9MICO|nr:glycerophosphodiester phosphodiesterase family protein [Humibacter ginsenosidimutans]QDZ14889.1 glycerophosphodiester phosphodiesterase [Humibacter ginsenosidimutans]
MPSPSVPMIIGHRGAPGYRPEHTRASYELAFALGADAVEPDVVATKDGVLVLRHENEISATTDVASRPEFTDLRTTKLVDGVRRTGWFTEDFTWAQLSTLRAVERLPELRQGSSSFDGRYPIMRLSQLFDLVDRESERAGRSLGLVVELKHATYFEQLGLPLDELFASALLDAGWNDGAGRLVVESFERTVLTGIRARSVRAKSVYLIEATGAPFDAVARDGAAARTYAQEIDGAGLYALATATGHEAIDGISVSKTLLLDAAGDGTTDLVDRAHGVGLQIFTWTLRPENRFLGARFRRGGAAEHFGDWQREYEVIMETGVDAVFADHPDLAIVARDALAG